MGKSEEFFKKREDIINAHKYNLRMSLKALEAEFCEKNNPIKVGDVVTDSQKSIRVTKITNCYNEFICAVPTCMYSGVRVKKNGEPWPGTCSKDTTIIYQSKVKTINGQDYDFRKEVDYVLS